MFRCTAPGLLTMKPTLRGLNALLVGAVVAALWAESRRTHQLDPFFLIGLVPSGLAWWALSAAGHRVVAGLGVLANGGCVALGLIGVVLTTPSPLALAAMFVLLVGAINIQAVWRAFVSKAKPSE